MLLPDQATFIIDNTVIGPDTMLNANHHCNVGTTGVLCMPTYILHKVKRKNENRNRKWFEFQSRSAQSHNADQNHGGIFTLSPDDASTVLDGDIVEDSLFPEGFVSLVSEKYPYLLGLSNNLCIGSSDQYENRYDNGILCKAELRALKIYTRGLISGSAPQLKVDIWYNDGGVGGQTSSPDSTQLVGFHQIGADGVSKKQGYSVPVIPGTDHSYRISLTNGDLPDDWVIEFSDPIIGNRWLEDELFLSVAGRSCGNNGLISSQHDRRFIWGGNGYLDDQAWYNHGACVGSEQQPPSEPFVSCGESKENNIFIPKLDESKEKMLGIIEATQCPEKCQEGCNSNSYCDCGLEICQCKAGFTGLNCEVDLCADAMCGEHGSCSARYLGGEIPVIDKACICEDSWLGERCDRNPCIEMGIDCSGNGNCVAVSETDATCECNEGYVGDICEERSACEGFCQGGNFPYFGCASDVQNKVGLGCFKTGGCFYLDEGENYPYDGFCTYKTYNDNVIFSSNNFVPNPPVETPIQQPISAPIRCGCDKCTESVWNTIVDGYSCGGRISFLASSDTTTLESVGITNGPFDETSACQIVSEEYPETCTCICIDDDSQLSKPVPLPILSPTNVPSFTPIESPTSLPSSEPVAAPSTMPSLAMLLPTIYPTTLPTSKPTFLPSLLPSANHKPVPMENENGTKIYCGCSTCNDIVWDTEVDGYTCGFRIQWLQTLQATIVGGPYDEATSCRQISEEFPEDCGRFCNPEKCGSISSNRNLRGSMSRQQ